MPDVQTDCVPFDQKLITMTIIVAVDGELILSGMIGSPVTEYYDRY